MTLPQVETDVLIVGAGPVGLSASLYLSQLGISNCVLEKYQDIDSRPRAHSVTQSSVEFLRLLGMTSTDFSQIEIPQEKKMFFSRDFLVNQSKIGELAEDLVHDRAMGKQIPQHKLTKWLKLKVQSAPLSQLLFGCKLENIDFKENYVVCETNSKGSQKRIKAHYLLGADGAKSHVRNLCKIPLEGDQHIRTFVAIHVKGDLRPVVQKELGIVYKFISPEGVGFAIVYDIKDSFIFHRPIFPPYETLEDFTDTRCRDIIKKITKHKLPDFEIININSWEMSAVVAKTYQKDRVFLIGDAAHKIPATGGLGMNTGFIDVSVLCPKLKGVLKQELPASALMDYENLCRPVAKEALRMSKDINDNMNSFLELLGLRKKNALKLKRFLHFPFMRALPMPIKIIIEKILIFPIQLRLSLLIYRIGKEGTVQKKIITEKLAVLYAKITSATIFLNSFYEEKVVNTKMR